MALEKFAPNEEHAYIENLKAISATLNSHKINYAIVGGVALNTILGLPFKHRRKNGTLVDLDGILYGPDTETIKAAEKDLEDLSKQPVFPELGLESATFGKKSRLFNPFALLSGLHVDSAGRYFLTFGSIQEEIPAETMEITYRQYAGVTMPFLPAKTTLYRFLVRGGVLKPKDNEKLRALEEYIVEHADQEPPDGYYIPYLRFVERVREKYPISVNTYTRYWEFDRWIGGRLSGSSGFVYGLIGLFRSR